MKAFKIFTYVFTLTILFTSCAIVKPGEVGVRKYLGRLRGNIINPGPAFINPFTTSLVKIPTRTVNREVKLNLPSKEGLIPSNNYSVLADSEIGCKATIMGVNNDDSLFLIYLDEVGINIGNKIEIIKKINFDNSIEIKINQKKLHITEQVAKHLLIKKH